MRDTFFSFVICLFCLFAIDVYFLLSHRGEASKAMGRTNDTPLCLFFLDK